MSLLTKAGITKLSELEIDAAPDKTKDILELLLTQRGDVLYRDTEAARLAAEYGVGYNFLHAKNTGVDQPEWLDIQDVIAYLTGAVNRMIAPPTLLIPAPSLSFEVAEEHSGGGYLEQKTLDVPVSSITAATAVTTVDAVGGAVSHNDDVGDTDETAEANDSDPNDMNLLPAGAAVNDSYLLGYAGEFDAIALLVVTAGADYSLVYEYSRGAGAWGALTIVHNSTNQWKSTGKGWLTFERPGDWATDAVAGIADLYWIRARVTSVGGGYVQPQGTQAWILVY
jgi:hypothetical protein